MTLKLKMIHFIRNRNALWVWLIVALSLVALYFTGIRSANELVATQSTNLGQHWHQLISNQPAQTNDERIKQLGTLAFYPRITFLQMRLDQNFSQLANYNRGTHNYSSRVHKAVNRLERRQRRDPGYQAMVMHEDKLVLSASRIELPQSINGKRAYGIIIIGFDTTLLQQNIYQRFLRVYLLVILVILVMIGFLTVRHRVVFTDPLNRLVNEPLWQANDKDTYLLRTDYSSSLLRTLTKSINSKIRTFEANKCRLVNEQQQLKHADLQLALGSQLLATIDWKMNTHSGEFFIAANELTRIGLPEMPQHLEVRDLFNVLHPEDLSQIKAQFERLQREQITMEFTARVINRNNEMRYIKCISTFSSDINEAHILVGLSVDITTDVRQQQALRLEQIKTTNTESKLNTLMQLTDVGIIQTDRTGAILSLNAAGHRMLGYQDQQLVSRNANLLMPIDSGQNHSLAGFIPPLATQSSSKAHSSQVELRKFDGSSLMVNLSMSEQNIDGSVYSTAVFRELKLPSSTQSSRLTSILDSKPLKQVRFVIIDDNQQIVGISPALSKTLGYRSVELIDHNIIDLVPTRYQQATKQQCVAGKSIDNTVATLYHHNGTRLWFKISMIPLNELESKKPLMVIQVSEVINRPSLFVESRQSMSIAVG